MFTCAVPNISQAADGDARKAAEAQLIPLQPLGKPALLSKDYFAFAEPALCDEDQNTYFLLVPDWTEKQEADPSFKAPVPRDVLQISSDGKKRVTFSPTKISKFESKFGSATNLRTLSFAIDRNGLYMLIWAEWRDKNGQPDTERSGQHIVSFDRNGEYRSSVEVNWREIVVTQFDVFGSGEFLLRGKRINPQESRVSVLSGQTLQDIGSLSAQPWGDPQPESGDTKIEGRSANKVSRMARGSDGRIYVTQDDMGLGETVFAVSPSGQTERLFRLPALPRDPPLIAWKASDDRFAASYQMDTGDVHNRYVIAVYRYSSNTGNASDAEAETTLYAAPGPLLCYQRRQAKDRFTFLTDGSVVTMSSP